MIRPSSMLQSSLWTATKPVTTSRNLSWTNTTSTSSLSSIPMVCSAPQEASLTLTIQVSSSVKPTTVFGARIDSHHLPTRQIRLALAVMSTETGRQIGMLTHVVLRPILALRPTVERPPVTRQRTKVLTTPFASSVILKVSNFLSTGTVTANSFYSRSAIRRTYMHQNSANGLVLRLS